MRMTPRERVLAAINHEQPDRVPIVVGVSNATGIKMKTYQKLKKLVGPARLSFDALEARIEERLARAAGFALED